MNALNVNKDDINASWYNRRVLGYGILCSCLWLCIVYAMTLRLTLFCLLMCKLGRSFERMPFVLLFQFSPRNQHLQEIKELTTLRSSWGWCARASVHLDGREAAIVKTLAGAATVTTQLFASSPCQQDRRTTVDRASTWGSDFGRTSHRFPKSLARKSFSKAY